MAEVKNFEGPKFKPKEEYPNASNAARNMRQPVAHGSIKKPFWKVAIGWLISDDVGDIRQDIIGPAMKDLAYNIITTMFYGSARANRGGYSQPRRNYTDYSRQTQDFRNKPRETKPLTNLNDYKDITVPTREQAEDVINDLRSLCDMYQFATVNDLWQAIGITRDNPMETKWGWTGEMLMSANIKPAFGEWRIVMPNAIYLDME